MKDYNSTIKKASRNVEQFLQKTFANIYFTGPPIQIKELNANPTMIVCSHRSHLDYILLGVELHKAGLIDMRFAAGDNLTHMPYIGKNFAPGEHIQFTGHALKVENILLSYAMMLSKC
jgi:glycerol-3-phosphate O-acyltransferase